MKKDKYEDVKDIAMQMNELLKKSPEDFYYLKGFIHHCFMQRENKTPPHDTPKQSA